MLGNIMIAAAVVLFICAKGKNGGSYPILESIDKIINPYYTRTD